MSSSTHNWMLSIFIRMIFNEFWKSLIFQARSLQKMSGNALEWLWASQEDSRKTLFSRKGKICCSIVPMLASLY